MKLITLLPLMLLTTIAEAGRGSTRNTPDHYPPIQYIQYWSQGVMKFVYIDSKDSENKQGIFSLSKKLCENESVCIVMFWDNVKLTPRRTPMTDEQVAAKVAHYLNNKNSGLNTFHMCRESGC